MTFQSLLLLVERFRWNDLVDILLMGFIAYRGLLIVRKTRTVQMFTGFLLIVGCYFLFRYLDLTGMNAILENVFASLAVIVAVIFQGDIRTALTQIGQAKLFRNRRSLANSFIIDRLANACENFSQTKTGALIVMENRIGLKSYARSGTGIDGELTSGLLISIFNKLSPLHDGALILDGGLRVVSAGSILPLSRRRDHLQKYGTRHRAALGVMEESDARVIVVSEETGRIAFGADGNLEEIEPFQLKTKLYSVFSEGTR